MLITLFFLEPFLYIELIRKGGRVEKVNKYRLYQKLSDLVTENMFFGALGLMLLVVDISKDRTPGKLIIISIMLSISKAIYIIVQIYFTRIEKY